MENTTEERMENTTETRMGGMDMSDKKMNAESLRGTVCVLLSAVCFSTGGVLIKSIPWSSVTIQGRAVFSRCWLWMLHASAPPEVCVE